MPLPNKEKWKEISLKVFNCTFFPNCLGAIDGKHISIQVPANSDSKFLNLKKTFSTVVLAFVDVTYNFLVIDIGGYERNIDGGIPFHSSLSKM